MVRDGKFFTIGDEGAQFFRYKPNDIIFNATQTESLFKYGGIKGANPRGKVYANGSAFADGSYPSEGKAFWNASVGSSLFSAVRNVTSSLKSKNKNKGTQKETEVKITVKNDKVKTELKSPNINTNATESDFSKENQKNSEDKLKTENTFEETFDWIEIAISRIEREIDNLDKKVNSTYASWSDRNTALNEEINKVGEEIKLQSDAADKYLAKANDVGLTEKDSTGKSYADLIKEGNLNIEDFEDKDDEALVEKIKNYQKWYELYLKCTDAAEDLRQEEANLYAQRFENVQSRYDGILQGFEHTETMLNEYISQAEAKGYIVSKEYYDALITNNKDAIETLEEERGKLINERNNYFNKQVEEYLSSHEDATRAQAETAIKDSQQWRDMCNDIDSVTQEIESATTQTIEWQNAIRDIDWEVFDLIQERISDVTAEADFLKELLSHNDLYDDKGNFTEYGMVTMGLHAQNMNTYMYQADDYGAKVKEIDDKIASGELDGYSAEVVAKRREYVELQREAILNAEQEKQAIKDLVSEGIEKELDALQERIDLHNKEIDSMRDLYDYQKSVQKQSEEIANLEKQRASYLGDNSEEGKAKLQEITVSLKEAKQSLEETEFDRYITQQEQLLDELYNEYSETLNTRLDDVDGLIMGVILEVNNSASTISSTLTTEATKVGTTLSTAMQNIWNGEGDNVKSVLTIYGTNFQNYLTTTNTTLGAIKTAVNNMAGISDAEANENINSNNTNSSSNADPTKNNEPPKEEPKEEPKKEYKELSSDTIKGIAAAIWCLKGKGGWGDDPFREGKLTEKIGAENAAKVQDEINESGGTGALWLFYASKKFNLSKYKYNAFATGAKNIDETQLAWTQEKGQEFIVRPSDGAILTPVAKKDSILNAKASENLWNMSNSPAEFIKDNLRLDTTNVPNNSNVQNSCVQNFKNITFSLPNVHSYNELLREMKDDQKFEKLILSMTLDQIAGKSSLAKGKSIR